MEDAIDLVFKALADPTRRNVLDLLKRKPQTTGELVERFPAVSRFAVMKHLGVLEGAGLVIVRREGRHRWNHLNAVPLRRLYERWVGRYESQWAAGMLALKRVVEGGERGPEEGAAGVDEELAQLHGRVLRIEQEVVIKGSPERVFRAIAEEAGSWWPHRFKPEGSKVVIEPRLGGRFYEDWGGGSGALFAEITFFDPPRAICTRGPMGMRGAASTVKWYRLEPHRDGTTLKMSLHAWGDIPAEIAASYTSGSGEALEALRRYVEEVK